MLLQPWEKNLQDLLLQPHWQNIYKNFFCDLIVLLAILNLSLTGELE